MTKGQQDLASAPEGFHSILGKAFSRDEYVVYRYGQALPYLKITYRAPPVPGN
jgi:hypothetical protein